jgi:hypothetical protein
MTQSLTSSNETLPSCGAPTPPTAFPEYPFFNTYGCLRQLSTLPQMAEIIGPVQI